MSALLTERNYRWQLEFDAAREPTRRQQALNRCLLDWLHDDDDTRTNEQVNADFEAAYTPKETKWVRKTP